MAQQGASQYTFIAAPADPTKQDTVNKVRDKLASKHNDLSEIFPFQLPEFKDTAGKSPHLVRMGDDLRKSLHPRVLPVGTLDSLVVLSDDLNKADASVEAIAIKIADNMRNLLNNDIEQWKSNLSVNDKSIDSFLRAFHWNSMKYRTDRSLRELSDMILQEVNQIDTLMKNKMQAYTTVKGALQGIQRKQTGNLAVRSLNDIVKKDQLVLDSEYLTTLIVAVPKSSINEWIAKYETLTQMVVPRSSQKIAEDSEYALFTVTLFQRIVDEFTHKAREQRFNVREFKWDAPAMAAEKKALAEMGATERDQWTTLLRLSKTNFGEVYSCYIHLKALRVFVESILRYGLPPDFQPMLLKAKPKQERKVRDALNRHFAKLGGAGISNSASEEQAIEENLAALIGDKDYSPCVLFQINTIV
ncbi:ATPase, V1 complex, subunit C [Phlyctochytrium arcticum]|nr:ATPase, V1 complex, subunit C [Phlyctochytrium arcticum]